MKRFRITYFLKPEADNIVICIYAKTYEKACIFAKDYRKESFACEEIEGRDADV